MLKKSIAVFGLSLALTLAIQVSPAFVYADDATNVTAAPVTAPTLPAVPPSAPPGIPAAPAVAALPVEVSALDANLRYVGRFEMSSDDATFEWSASSITIRFHGTDLNATLNLGGNRIQVIVDGQPTKVLGFPPPKDNLYSVASGLPAADHTVTLFKMTEANVGQVHFLGFQLNQGAILLPAPVADKRIEVIGDSISAGYGDEATKNTDHFKPGTENAYKTYGALTARAFGAEYVCIAWSGRKLWPDNTLPSIYDKTLPLSGTSLWNFDGWKPQVVLVNLCTNDFRSTAPEEEGWVKAYHDFVAHVRANYPGAVIYLAVGPMLNDGWPQGAMMLTKARSYIQRIVTECNTAGDAKIHFLEFAPQDAANGYGADWHPSLKTHQIMAQTFSEAIQKDLGWQPVASAPATAPRNRASSYAFALKGRDDLCQPLL